MFFQDFFQSIKSYSEAFSLLNKLSLWKYCIIPAVISLLVGLLIIVLAFYTSAPLGKWMAEFWPFDFWKETMSSIGVFLAWVLIVVIGLLMFRHLVMAFSAPFMTPVSEKVEQFLTGKKINPTDTAGEFMAALIRGVRINIRNLIVELLFTIPLMILSLIPLVNLVTAFLILYIQFYFAGFGNMDYTMERYFSYADTKKFVRKHSGIAVGNGFIFHLVLMIPFVGMIIVLPLATVASTVDVIRKINKD